MLPAALPRLDSVPVVGAMPGALADQPRGHAHQPSSAAARPTAACSSAPTCARRARASTAGSPRTGGSRSPRCRWTGSRRSSPPAGVTVNDTVVAICAGGDAGVAGRARRAARPSRWSRWSRSRCAAASRWARSATASRRCSCRSRPTRPIRCRRLQRAHEILARAKERHRALPADLLADASQFIPPALAARAARVTSEVLASSRLAPPLNLVISNVPGPARAAVLRRGAAGAQLPGVGHHRRRRPQHHLPELPRPRRLRDRRCSRMVDDAWSIMAAIERELTVLDEAVCGPPAPSAPEPSPQPA